MSSITEDLKDRRPLPQDQWRTETTPAHIAATLAAGLALFYLMQAVYRIYFHPLRAFAGPLRARFSEDLLYNISKTDFPEEAFEALHNKHRTKAIRIGPNELHLSDIELYKVIYSQTNPYLKHSQFYDGFNTPHTIFAETDPALHKERRRLLSPMFSRATLLKLEPVFCDKIFRWGQKVNRVWSMGPINIYSALRQVSGAPRLLLTTEIIMEFAFSKAANMIEEHETEFRSWYLDAFDVGNKSLVEMQYRPWLLKASRLLPLSTVKYLNREVAQLLHVIEFAGDCMREWQASNTKTSHPVLFEALESLSDAEKVTEANDILVAGSDTTASTLTTGIYYILSDAHIHAQLVQSLDDGIPNGVQLPSLAQLQKIDYLTACVMESIRMGMASPGRLPRVVPGGGAAPLVVDGKVVPPGTVVSISAYTMHTSTEAWGPDACSFNPSRWQGPDAKRLEQYQCTFSKGARMCMGQNIAVAEITMILAFIFRNYEVCLVPGTPAPRRIDRFTMHFADPGLPIKFVPRHQK
ncbi:hypothetical protein N8T08_009666 [Aspergillus melleus]|uniref:Uncharacterized protein n=1 Tax=Aspergillus melleus TaxID=138277 RepID=A0ACC3AT56_9EURO|nr:hypothetical protein N8T08_009666 [Aspergillus melleus]